MMGMPTAVPTPPTAAEVAEEAERVYLWRLRVILSAREEGVLMEPAIKLARSDADLHKIVDALGAGCPVGTAVDIFT